MDTTISHLSRLSDRFPHMLVEEGKPQAPVIYITIMRDPLDRLLSAYLMDMQYTASCTFEEWLVRRRTPPYETELSYLLGRPTFRNSLDESKGTLPIHLEEAKARLRMFSLVLIKEWFGSLGPLISNVMKWNDTMPHKHFHGTNNQANMKSYLTERNQTDLYQELRRRWAYSYALYDYAKHLCRKQLIERDLQHIVPE